MVEITRRALLMAGTAFTGAALYGLRPTTSAAAGAGNGFTAASMAAGEANNRKHEEL